MKGQIPSFSWQAETKIDKITSLRERVARLRAMRPEVKCPGVAWSGSERHDQRRGWARH
jgi:hypothetical protein